MSNSPTYNFICFTDLLNERDLSQQETIEKKIKRRLKYYKLDAYDAKRVDYIRALKNELSTEVTQFSKSRYYQKSHSEYAALEDFDVTRMVSVYCEKYKDVEPQEMRAFIQLALYHFYLR